MDIFGTAVTRAQHSHRRTCAEAAAKRKQLHRARLITTLPTAVSIGCAYGQVVAVCTERHSRAKRARIVQRHIDITRAGVTHADCAGFDPCAETTAKGKQVHRTGIAVCIA